MAAASLKTEMTPSSHVFPDRDVAVLQSLQRSERIPALYTEEEDMGIG